MIVARSRVMLLKILLGLASFMAIHSLTMMHMCHVGLKCDNSSEMMSECLEMISSNYSAWCVSAALAFAMVLICCLSMIFGTACRNRL